MWGFPPTIIRLVVDHMGPLRAIGWFGAHMPRFLASRVVLGLHYPTDVAAGAIIGASLAQLSMVLFPIA